MRAELKNGEVDVNQGLARPLVVLALKKGSRIVFQGYAARVLAICSPTQILLRIDGSDKTVWACAGGRTNRLPTDRRGLFRRSS